MNVDKDSSRRFLREQLTSAVYEHDPKELRFLREQIISAVDDHDPEKLDRLLQERNALIQKQQQQQNQEGEEEDMGDETDIELILQHAATSEYTQCPEAFHLLYENLCNRTKKLHSNATVERKHQAPPMAGYQIFRNAVSGSTRRVFCWQMARLSLYHFSPLHWAAEHGLVDLVQWLVVKQGCNVNQYYRDHGISTPMTDAIRAGQSNVVRVLVEKHGATISSTDAWAALQQSTEIVAILVHHKAVPMEQFISMLRKMTRGIDTVQDHETIVAIVRIFVQRTETDFETACHLQEWLHNEMEGSFFDQIITKEACTLLAAGMSGHAFLYRAIQVGQGGHPTFCRLLVEQHGINPLIPGGDGSGKFLLAPVNAAAQRQDLGVLEQFLRLLNQPQNIDAGQHHQQLQYSNSHGDLVMHVICRDPQVTIQAIQLAVEQYQLGSTLKVANNEGLGPVHIAAKSGVSISVLYYLLRQCPLGALGQLTPLPTNNNSSNTTTTNNNNNNATLEALQAQFDSLGAEKDAAIAENVRLRALLVDKDTEITRLGGDPIDSLGDGKHSEMEDAQKASSRSSTSKNVGIKPAVDPALSGLVDEPEQDSLSDDAEATHPPSKKAKTGH